jgi:superfamily II DNA/RNA helicase
MIEMLSRGRSKARMPRALVLEPTRELADQVSESFDKYSKYSKLNHALLIGGVSMDEQVKKLDRGVDVLIATPGRLMDHFERGRILLSQVNILVIDEADRMLDMGFIPDIEKICKLLPPRRQTLFFSATMPPEITRLVDQFLKDPVRIEVARPATTAKTITQSFKFCDSTDDREKRATLRELLHDLDVKNAIIFCNRKRDVAILLKSLVKHGFSAGAIHGDLDQTTRMATLDAFREGRIQLLAASDVAARGLDIPDVSHVFNYDVPWQADDYVHRIGRTGRAGKQGNSVTIVTPDDIKAMSAIGKLIDEEPKWMGEAPDAETMADGMKRRGRGRRGAGSDRGGRDARGKGDRPRERGGRDRGQRPPRNAEVGSVNGAEAEVADAPQRAHDGGEERSRPRREERSREGRRNERRDEPRQEGGRGERGAKPQAQQKSRPQGRSHEDASARKGEAAPRKDEAAPRKSDARERQPVAFGLDENVPAFLRRPVRIAGR